MKNNTKLTFTLQGISDHDGKIDVIDNTQDNVEAIMAFTFKEKDDDVHAFAMTAIGAFSLKYYSEIIQHMIDAIGRESFTKALMLSEIMSKFDKEHCGGGLDLQPFPGSIKDERRKPHGC